MQQETKRRKVVGTRKPDKQFVDGEADDECSDSKRKSAVTATSTKANVAVETNNNIVKNRYNLMKSLAVLEQSKPT